MANRQFCINAMIDTGSSYTKIDDRILTKLRYMIDHCCYIKKRTKNWKMQSQIDEFMDIIKPKI